MKTVVLIERTGSAEPAPEAVKKLRAEVRREMARGGVAVVDVPHGLRLSIHEAIGVFHTGPSRPKSSPPTGDEPAEGEPADDEPATVGS